MALAQNGNAVEDQSYFEVAPGVSLFKDAGAVTPGVSAYQTNSYTNLNRYFARRQSASLDGPFGRPHLEAYVIDGYGNPIPTVNISLAILDSDGTQENTQNLATDANGRIRWNYQIGPTDKDFCAFDRTSPDDPDALGAHHIAIPLADVYKPAGSKTGTYQDPKTPTTTRDFDAATFPARAKDVRLTGNAYGANEPTDTEADVFGIHGEIIFAGMASVAAGDRTTDANGVPTSPSVRGKPTAAGSFNMKTTGRINEANGLVIDTAAHNPTDRAGRAFSYASGFEFVGRRAVFDRVLLSSPLDTGTNLGSQENLESPQGYSIHGTASQTFDTLAAPSDGTTYGYYQGFSNLSATRDSFGLAAGSVEIPGFTVESGLRGYRLLVLEYTVIRDDLFGELVVDKSLVVPGETVRFKAKAYQVLPDKSLVPKDFDDAPVLYLGRENGAGNPLVNVTSLTMDAIGALPTGDYEDTYTPPALANPGVRETYGVIGFSTIAGARVNLSPISFTVGFINPDVRLVADIGHTTGGGHHLVSGDDIEVNVFGVNGLTGDTVALDSTPAPEAYVLRQNGTTLEYLDPVSETWKEAVSQGPVVPHELTLQGDVWRKDLGVVADLGTKDLIVVGNAYIGGAHYTDRVFREVVDTLNRHDEVDKRLVPFVGDFDLEGRHWIPGDDFTATILALFNDDGAIASSPLVDDIVNYAITGVDQGTRTFTVAGDQTADIPAGRVIEVTGSTGNDGDYVVESATENGGNTDIVVVQAIPDATVDGSIDNDRKQPSMILIDANNNSLQLDDSITLGPIIAHGLKGGTRTWAGAVTAAWPSTPLFLFFAGTIADSNGNDVPLEGSVEFEVVDVFNKHSELDCGTVSAQDAVGVGMK